MENEKIQLKILIKEKQTEYLIAKTEYETVCEIARACENRVLKEHEFCADKRFIRRNCERICDSKQSYLISEGDYKRYRELCLIEYAEYGIVPSDPDYIAEHRQADNLRAAEDALLELGLVVVGQSNLFTEEEVQLFKEAQGHLKYRKRLINLILSLDADTLKN